MAYKLDLGVKTVHGTNPQNLIEHIVRERIFASSYWKEECFGLNAAALAKRAMNLTYVGGTWGGARRPTPFLCLLLKMLMIQPEMDIVEAFINERDFRYVRLLGVFYLRLVGTGEEIYKCLEALYSDNRKFKMRHLDGNFTVEYIDDFIDQLLTTTRVCDTTLPPLVMRKVLVERGKLGPRKSLLDDELKELEEIEESKNGRSASPHHRGRSPTRSPIDSPRGSPVRRGRSPEHPRRSARSPSSSPPPFRSLSSQRVGFRSPSPSRDTRSSTKVRGNASPDAPPSRRAERSPDVGSRRGERSPDDIGSKRGARSPVRRGERSPDGMDSRRADRSPDASRYSRRDERSPVRHHSSRRYSPSPDRYRGRSERSPDRRESDRYGSRDYRDSRDARDYDSRRGYDRRDDRDEYSKKRSRSSYQDEEDDRYNSQSKRAKFGSSSGSSYKDRDYSSKSSSQKSGGKSGGGLREMSTDEMNELRKSIGLGPLRS